MQTAYWDRKAVVFGAVERGGRIRANVVPDSRASTSCAKVHEFVVPGSTVYTDDYEGYNKLGREGLPHHRINHSGRVYVDGDVHTQTIEGFFGLFKNGVRGVYHSVSKKWLQGYLNEYVWRYNHRDDREAMLPPSLPPRLFQAPGGGRHPGRASSMIRLVRSSIGCDRPPPHRSVVGASSPAQHHLLLAAASKS